METCLLAQKNSNNRVKFIKIVVDGDTVAREWGILDGKVQSTSNTYDYINKGKANELNPSMAAKADYDRIIATKTKEGYVIVNDLKSNVDIGNNDKMDFENLPTQFCCSKPNTSITERKADSLLKSGLGKCFVKENGLCHFVLITPEKKVKIYTRRMDEHTIKYPYIVECIEKLDLPANSLLITEFIIDASLKIPHMEGFKLMSKISRTNTVKGKVKEDVSEAIALQDKYPVKAMLFYILYLDGECFTSVSYDQVLKFIYNI